MSRTINKERSGELRDAIVRYLLKHGLTGLSLRPMARALGCSPRTLLYHFGSKEKMVTEVLAQIRQQQRTTYDRIYAKDLPDAYYQVWKRMSASDSEPLFRLFFEVYGIALRQPRRYKDFLQHTHHDWLHAIKQDFSSKCDPKEAEEIATAILAGFRGFMLDYCATQDRKRLDRAVQLWLRGLQSTFLNQ